MSEIQEISNEIDYTDLIYNFKTKGSAPINFIKFKGPFGLFREIRDDNISLTKAEENQKDFKKELGQMTSGNPWHKEKYQLDTIKSVKIFITHDKKLLIYLMIVHKLDLKLFINQNKMKQNKVEQDLKY